MNTLEQRWSWIQEVIAKGKHKQNVRVVAVTKNCSVQAISEAYALGITEFGENYVQEALPKILDPQLLNKKIEWHFVGSLQTNKMNKIIPAIQWMHSLSQNSQVEKLEKMREQGVAIPRLLIQINVASEDTKSGLLEDQIQPFVESISSKSQLEICGLMVFPPYQTHPEDNRRYFTKAYEWKEKINEWKLPRIQMSELSMGVSNDYSIAIEEGATMIRIGEALFGVRT